MSSFSFASFAHDAKGQSLYSMPKQYSDESGPFPETVNFSQSIEVPSPHPCGYTWSDQDLEDVVTTLGDQNHLQPGFKNLFVLFTGPQVSRPVQPATPSLTQDKICTDIEGIKGCSHTDFCGYHYSSGS
jgi:hypothetical protein